MVHFCVRDTSVLGERGALGVPGLLGLPLPLWNPLPHLMSLGRGTQDVKYSQYAVFKVELSYLWDWAEEEIPHLSAVLH